MHDHHVYAFIQLLCTGRDGVDTELNRISRSGDKRTRPTVTENRRNRQVILVLVSRSPERCLTSLLHTVLEPRNDAIHWFAGRETVLIAVTNGTAVGGNLRPDGDIFTEGDTPFFRKAVDFRSLNLSEVPYRSRLPEREYDLVLCRNVLIYFSMDLANRVVDSLGDMIRPDGYLLVGHSEAFGALNRFEVHHTNATYYYRKCAGEKKQAQAGRSRLSLAIPGIGLNTMVPKNPTVRPRSENDPAAATSTTRPIITFHTVS